MTVSPPLNPILMELSGNGSLAGRDRAGAFTATGSGALRYAPAPGARINYAPNGSAENAAGFSNAFSGGVSTTRTRVTNTSSHGGASARLVNPGTAAYETCTAFVSTVSAPWLKSLAGQQVWMRCKWKGTGKVRNLLLQSYRSDYVVAVGGTTYVDVIPPTDWTELVLGPVTVYGDPGDIRITFANMEHTDGSRAYDIYVDEAMLTTQDPTGWAYFDGSSAGANWLDPRTGQLGTAHASPSVSEAVFWVEEATTNLCVNPSFETNASLWWSVSADLARDTTAAYLGTASMKVTRNNAATFFNCYHTTAAASVAPGDVLTISARLRGAVSLANFSIDGNWKDSSSTNTGSALLSPTFTLATGGWTYVTFTTPAAPALTDRVTIGFTQRQTGTIGDAFFIDCVQIEKKAYATSYCDGSLGTGYTWAGTAHASASSRVASGVAFPSAARFTSINGAAVLRQSQLVAQSDRLWDFGAYAGVGFGDSLTLITSNVAGTTMQMLAYTGAPAGSVSLAGVTPGTSQTLWAKWSATLLSLAINAGAWTNGTRTITPTGVSMSPNYPNISVGKPGTQTGKALGSILAGPFITYEAPLSDARRAMVNAAIDSNGATDLWTLFEEWEGIIQPADLLALQSGQATAGVTAELAPIDLLPLQSGQATAGVTAELAVLELDMMGEELVATARRPFPYLVTWRSP